MAEEACLIAGGKLMKASIALLSVTLAGMVFSTYCCDVIHWGFGGLHRASLNVSPDGSLNLQNKLPGERSAIDLRPSPAVPGIVNCSEFTAYARDDANGMERANFSVFENGPWPQCRIGIERRGDGDMLPVKVAFEDFPAMGQCLEPFVIRSPEAAMNDGGLPHNRLIVDPVVPAIDGSGVYIMFRHGPDPGNVFLRPVEMGAPNSAGTGYRTLRIAN